MTTRSEIDELRDQLRTLQREVADGRRRIAELESGRQRSIGTVAPPARSDRRTALRLAAGAAAGAAGAVLASRPVAADDPNDLTLGQDKAHGGGYTQASNTGTSDEMAFVFEAGNAFSGASSLAPAALGGWTTQPERPSGVFGYTTEQGSGVVGIHQISADSITVPARTGVFGVSTAGNGAGVRGEGDTAMVAAGESTGLRATGGTGVWTSGSFLGVRGSSTSGAGGQFTGGRAHIQIGSGFGSGGTSSVARAPYDGAPFHDHQIGSLIHGTDAPGVENVLRSGLWLCVEGGTPGDWRCVGGPESAGTLFPITPIRVYDSRLDMEPDPDGPMSAGDDRTFSAADARDVTTGAVSSSDAIPERARAVAYNLTATQTASSGFLFLAPGGTTEVSASTINWSGPSTTIANAGIVRLDDQRRLTVLCGGLPDASSHVVVDIAGFYL